MKNIRFIDGLTAQLIKAGHLSVIDGLAAKRAFARADNITYEYFLLEEGIVEKEDLLQALANVYKVPAMDVMGAFFDHHFLTELPKNILLKHKILPYKRDEDSDILNVVVAEPSDVHREILGKYVSHTINFMVGIPEHIDIALEQYTDKPITWQPNQISNERMERSQADPHPSTELEQEFIENRPIPVIVQPTIDDYERT